MRKLFFLLAGIACSLLSFAQTNQMIWNNGRIQFAQPIANIDSLTFTGKVTESDTLHLILPRSTQQGVQDPTTVTQTSAQTNQVVWNNGRIQFAMPFANIDSLTYTGDVAQSDTLHLLLPRSIQQVVHDTVYIHDCDLSPDGVEAVDLGLPSGIKWASCNVGAKTPEGYGKYYAWGEVSRKTNYSWSTYKYANGSNTTLTKYCNDTTYGNNGFKDAKSTLKNEDDAALLNWGFVWRMPTESEWTELRNNCAWTWTTQNNVNGYLVTSNTNSNSIFLPAAGYRNNKKLSNVGSYGYYWSASLSSDVPYYAWRVIFSSDSYEGEGSYRYRGYTVRAVCQ